MTTAKLKVNPAPPAAAPPATVIVLRNLLPNPIIEGLGHPVLPPNIPVEVPVLTNWLKDQIAAGHVEIAA